MREEENLGKHMPLIVPNRPPNDDLSSLSEARENLPTFHNSLSNKAQYPNNPEGRFLGVLS